MRRAMGLGLLVAGAIWPTAASAQFYGQLLESEIPLKTVTGRNLGVRDRLKPELDQIGMSVGSFHILPAVAAGVGYTSNVIGAEVNKSADGYAEIRPELAIRSDWTRHSLNAIVQYDGLRYFNTKAKNQDGFLARVEGSLNVHDESSIIGSASFRRTYEDQQEATFPANGGGAISVEQPQAQLRATYVVNRVRLTGSVDYNGFSYGDTISTTGARLDLSFRNRDVYRASGRFEYLLGQDNSIFGQATYRRTDYRTSVVADDRTSNEWRVGLGAIADVTNLVRVAGAVGYYHRTYDNKSVYRSVGGLAVDVRADYYLSQLTTITAIVSRQIEEAAVTGSSGYVATRYGARVDHELLRNLIPYLFADRFLSKFKGVDRDDRSWDAGGGVDYRLSRIFMLSPNAAYVSRTSVGTARGPNINELRGLITLKYTP
ncbi:outer membrane beta-barrel protein [Sphingomonas sp. AP4-R1]|uniref:outer membrane beta-barrel protein n=1 Tax=Sphingomonas sp. AP4-R1 TaxID=2735134 RepID=UPI001493801D|nr:outer membrane beta-barrel protein [Sphingomonas sp. AP4-R1]QJU57268.1 outer membrane beta-barrel protein [Sphingomonas sp. AP4-R1]